jgi:hypothetical protein
MGETMLAAPQPMVAKVEMADGRTFVVSARAAGATDDELRAIERNDDSLSADRKQAIVFTINEAMNRFCGMTPEGRA